MNLLGEFYSACNDDSSSRPVSTDPAVPVPETIPDSRRTEAPFVATLIKNMNDPNLNSSSKCILCKKSFKAVYYTVKHLMNKHTGETTAALETIKQMLNTSITLCLSDNWFMRRYFYADSRPPIPWHEPTTLNNLAIDNSASIQRLTMQGVSLPHFATALGPSLASVSGVLPSNNNNANSLFPFGVLPPGLLSMFPSNINNTGNRNNNNRFNNRQSNGPNSRQNNNTGNSLLGSGPSTSTGNGRFQRNQSGGPMQSTGPIYRDKDAPKTSVVNIPKPNYGTAIVSYDDI